MQLQSDAARVRGKFSFEQVRDGKVIDRWQASNMVVNTGLTDLLEKYFNGSTYTAAHHMGLTDSGPTIAAGDTMGTGNHAGWTEETGYSEANRPTLNFDAAASQAIDNSDNKAAFSMSATATIGGAFIVVNENTKGGETGTLFCVVAFDSGDRGVLDGDTLNVQYTLTLSDT